MGRILVSGLVNVETTAAVRGFPINYYPIDYPFFGIDSAVSGVAFNIAKALKGLGQDVTLLSMTGQDFAGEYIRRELEKLDIVVDYVLPNLRQTPSSVVLYDPEGKRQVYCDLKDLQESSYPFSPEAVEKADLVVACNTNFNRPLLRLARAMGKPVATDVHVLGNIWDEYNRDFLECADILFLSDEAVGEDYGGFLWELARNFGPKIIVLGRGDRGAAMYLREQDRILSFPAAHVGPVVNTLGAGDALFSAFVHAHSQGMGPIDALAWAQIFASKKIGTSGGAQGFPTAEEMDALWAQFG